MGMRARQGWKAGVMVLLAMTAGGARAGDEGTSASAAAVRLELQVVEGSTTAAKSVSVTPGQNALQVIEALRPAPSAADDEPWVSFPAAEGGHYVLFFRPEVGGGSDPRTDGLYALIHYSAGEPGSGRFLLPEALRGQKGGDFVVLRASLDLRTTRTAVAALGMTPESVRRLAAPAADLAPGDEFDLYALPDGSRTLLVYSAESGGGAPGQTPERTLSSVVALPPSGEEPFFLLPRERRGSPVPAEWQRKFAEGR